MGIIRFLLALAVLATHAPPIPGLRLPHGDVAVQVFFIVSGFYMSLILHEKYTGPSSYRLFLSNRFLRIFPSYWAILIAAILFGLITRGDATTPQNLWIRETSKLDLHAAIVVATTNVTLFGQDVMMFMGIRPDSGALYFTRDFWTAPLPVLHWLLVPQAWSIALELMFYIVAPFLVTRRLRVLFSIIGCSLAIRLFLVVRWDLRQDPWSYRFFPCEIGTFLLGALAYRLYRVLRERDWLKPKLTVPAAFVMLLFITRYVSLPIPSKRIVLLATFPIFLPLIFAFTKNIKWDRYIGELSYPLYLAQWFTLGALRHFGIEPNGILLAAATTAVSILILRFIDEPIDAFRQRRLKREQSQPAGELKVQSATA